MEPMNYDAYHESNHTIRCLSVFFSTALLLAAGAAMLYTGESAKTVWNAWLTIQTRPCPLVTDYFKLGCLPAAFLNAALGGYVCAAMLMLHKAAYQPNMWAGYFLVIAHCFYGLNLVNMIPPMLGLLLYCRVRHVRFRDHLDRVMFVTSFGPFFSELLFRYPMGIDIPLTIGGLQLNLYSVFLCAVLAVILGLALPPSLPGTAKLHRGFNLYNGGLATGLLGMLLYSFLYRTMGKVPTDAEPIENAAYDAAGNSYMLFCVSFYIIVFSLAIAYGWFKNGRTFRGYGKLLADTGYKVNFFDKYGHGLTWVNLGIYGLMMTAYFSVVILLTDGAGFTGPTCGIILAAMTFSASGQHPRNVWPVLAGYVLLSLLVHGVALLEGFEVPWTLSTQGYMNGAAFATGLCPFTGVYGKRAGIAAGFLSAIMCTTTSVMHGGFVLYNGGLTAGMAALILLPMLDAYYKPKVPVSD